MAQDATYQTTVYQEREGDRYVAASGGTFAVESGGSILIQNSGTLTLASGADLSLIAGANIGLAGADLLVDDFRRLTSEFAGTVVIEPAALGTNLAVSNLPANVRHVRIYGSDAAQSMSFWLTSVSAGREVFLYLQGDSTGTFTNASTQIDVSTSGCILLGSVGAAISGFEMHTSLASDCWVHLVATLDNTWAIVGQQGDIDE